MESCFYAKREKRRWNPKNLLAKHVDTGAGLEDYAA